MVFIATTFALAAAAGAAVAAGDNGDIKVHRSATDEYDQRNNPQVCVFYLDAFNFDANQSVQWRIVAGPPFKGTPAERGTMTVDVNGHGRTQDYKVPDATYKLFWNISGQRGKAKQKVFKVTCGGEAASASPSVRTAVEPSPSASVPSPTTAASASPSPSESSAVVLATESPSEPAPSRSAVVLTPPSPTASTPEPDETSMPALPLPSTTTPAPSEPPSTPPAAASPSVSMPEPSEPPSTPPATASPLIPTGGIPNLPPPPTGSGKLAVTGSHVASLSVLGAWLLSMGVILTLGYRRDTAADLR